MRMTLGMISNRYKSNLNSSLQARSYYSDRVTNGFRKFSSAAEDSVGAADAYSLRSQTHRNTDYDTNADSISSRLKTSESAVSSINTILKNVKTQVLAGVNGTNEKFDRNTYATSLREEAMKSIVTSMNVSDGSKYLFGGAKCDEAPFTVKNNELYYRGVNVNTGKTDAYADVNGTTIHFGDDNTSAMISGNYKVEVKQAAIGASNSVAVSGDTVTITMKSGSKVEDLTTLFKSTGTVSGIDFSKAEVDGSSSDLVNFSQGAATAVSDTVNLDKLANEKYFVDLGMGLGFDQSGNIDEQSAFDASQPGISYLGYGTASDTGLSQNVYTIVGKIADALADTSITQDQLLAKVDPYLKQLDTATNTVLSKITDFGSKEKFVEYVQDRTGDATVDLADRSQKVENVDAETAYTDYTYSSYLYNAALRVGTNILGTSIMDFMD